MHERRFFSRVLLLCAPLKDLQRQAGSRALGDRVFLSMPAAVMSPHCTCVKTPKTAEEAKQKTTQEQRESNSVMVIAGSLVTLRHAEPLEAYGFLYDCPFICLRTTGRAFKH